MTAAAPASALLPVFGPRPLHAVRGEGCYLIDAAGRRYLDFITGIGVNALGYGHPSIVRAIQDQAGLCLHTSNLIEHPYQAPLAEKLIEWSSDERSGFESVFFSNSGTEAMETALKCARAYANRQGRKRHRIIALDNGFHGRTAAALSITGRAKYRDPFLPLTPDTVFVPANDCHALWSAANQDTIAIVAETIQGEGGIHPLTEEFLRTIRRLATERDALWIADETQCGLGRTGARFAYLDFPGLAPDIVVTAKPLAGGLPLGATVFNTRAARAMSEAGMHGSTFGGGPLACRAALAFLGEVEALLPSIRKNGAYLQQRLRGLRSPVIREVRGRGLMAGVELTVPGDTYVHRAREQGLLLNCTHGNVLRMLPPYIVTELEIDQACDGIERVLS